MRNPVKSIREASARYKTLDGKDRRRFWIDGILNNALYILMIVFVVYTIIKNNKFWSWGAAATIISQVASYLPIALGLGGCLVLTGTDLSAGRVVGLTAAVSAILLQRADLPNRIMGAFPELPAGAAIVLAILATMVAVSYTHLTLPTIVGV